MSPEDPPGIDRAYLAQFFHDRGVDEFAVVLPSSIHAPPGRGPVDVFPACRSVIVFGKRMEDDLFCGPYRESSRNVTLFKRRFNDTTDDLVRALRENGSDAVADRSVGVSNGTIRVALSFKHYAYDAGFGSIGNSTLLLSPRFGNRLALSVILTDREFGPYPEVVPADDLCLRCGNCVHSCPENAIYPGSVDALRCRNVNGGIPGFLRPLLFRLFASDRAAPFLTPFVNRIAKTSVPRCSACLISCPHFHKGEGR